MPLSDLQKSILKTAWESKQAKVPRQTFTVFYTKHRTNVISRSLERLIDRGLIVGFGEKTQYKLFITKIKLTPKGKKTAQKILGQQTELPFIQ